MPLNKGSMSPKGKLRDPLTNAKDNGRIKNPPRYPNFGGMTDASVVKGSDLAVQKPGFEK